MALIGCLFVAMAALTEEEQLQLLERADEYSARPNADPLVAAGLYETVLEQVELTPKLKLNIQLTAADLYWRGMDLEDPADVTYQVALEKLDNVVTQVGLTTPTGFDAYLKSASIMAMVGDKTGALERYLRLRSLRFDLDPGTRRAIESRLQSIGVDFIPNQIVLLFNDYNSDEDIGVLTQVYKDYPEDHVLRKTIRQNFADVINYRLMRHIGRERARLDELRSQVHKEFLASTEWVNRASISSLRMTDNEQGTEELEKVSKTKATKHVTPSAEPLASRNQSLVFFIPVILITGMVIFVVKTRSKN